MAEFAPALFILFVVVLLPLISIFSYIDATATLYFATSAAARAAAAAPNIDIAASKIKEKSTGIIGGPLGSFANLSPRDGSGMKLTIIQISIADKQIVPFQMPIDTNKFMYEYHVSAKYAASPIFYPGQPIGMQCEASSFVEHPEGLSRPSRKRPNNQGGGTYG